MPDYQAYQKSISEELISIKDRVRYFIDNHHWAEDGRYKGSFHWYRICFQ